MAQKTRVHRNNTAPRLIGHVSVEVETREGALERLKSAIEDHVSGVWGFCNAHTANMAESDPSFREAVRRMTFFNDGVGINLASRRLYGASFPENLNGTDLTPMLLNIVPKGTLVFLLGGLPEVVEDASANLANEHPNVRIAGHHHGYFDSAQCDAVSSQIVASGAELILVGMGHPRQEIWATTYGADLGAPVLCVGALIDRLAGRVKRAPIWIRRLHGEWVFRLLLEPRRLAKRYLWGNLVFLYRVENQRSSRSAGRLQRHA